MMGLATCALLALVAQSVDHERGAWSSEMRQARPAAKPAALARPATAARPSSGLVGITLWRLRPSQASDQARILVHEDDTNREMTPERIRTSTMLFPNDRLRLTIESARRGYLYVISRERYRDGSVGVPYLIFPSKRILGGQHAVEPGRIVEIPEPTNRRPYLTLRRSRPDHAFEEVIVLVAPQSLPGRYLVESQPLALDAAEVERWRQQWGGPTRVLESRSSGLWTPAEKTAAATGSLLSPQDPAPQTLFRIERPADQPILVPIQLRLAE